MFTPTAYIAIENSAGKNLPMTVPIDVVRKHHSRFYRALNWNVQHKMLPTSYNSRTNEAELYRNHCTTLTSQFLVPRVGVVYHIEGNHLLLALNCMICNNCSDARRAIFFHDLWIFHDFLFCLGKKFRTSSPVISEFPKYFELRLIHFAPKTGTTNGPNQKRRCHWWSSFFFASRW